MRALAKANGLPVADLRELVQSRGGPTKTAEGLLRNESNSRSRDGVHLTAEGYRLLAERVAKCMEGRIRPGEIVVCLGDSITFGAHMPGQGTTCGETYPAWLSVMLNRMVGASTRDRPASPAPRGSAAR